MPNRGKVNNVHWTNKGDEIMEISLTDKAIKWFEEEYPLEKGDAIRFFGKTYGSTEVHDGFSVGMALDQPEDYELLGKKEINDRTYFTGNQDDWFFSRYNLEVDFDEEREEPIYHFNEE